MKIIAIEEHFTTQALFDTLRGRSAAGAEASGQVDYPYESNADAVQFIEHAPIGEADKERICHVNAERPLGIAAA